AEVGQGLATIGVTIEGRYSGDNRFATAREIYLGNDGWGNLAIIASGANFADACTVAPIAFSEKAPLFLVDANGMLDNESKALIASADFENLLIIGGTSAVSQDVEDWTVDLGYRLGEIIGTDENQGESYERQVEGAARVVFRIEGSNRYWTSAALANWAIDNLGYTREGTAVATGSNFPDALCGGYMQGKRKSVLLLSDTGREEACGIVASTAVTDTGTMKPETLIYLGGEAALPRSARAAITDVLMG
ncbi:MAG: cell wall-binding repeat-containing protein, partial [Coriobacteriaceae bacterium]|nr:cell wall-binding repeat-containing protein [Coriobacteriaceae bacterium]